RKIKNMILLAADQDVPLSDRKSVIATLRTINENHAALYEAAKELAKAERKPPTEARLTVGGQPGAANPLAAANQPRGGLASVANPRSTNVPAARGTTPVVPET